MNSIPLSLSVMHELGLKSPILYYSSPRSTSWLTQDHPRALIKRFNLSTEDNDRRMERHWWALKILQRNLVVPELLWPEQLKGQYEKVVVVRFIEGTPAKDLRLSKKLLLALGNCLSLVHKTSKERIIPQADAILTYPTNLWLQYSQIIRNSISGKNFNQCKKLWSEEANLIEKYVLKTLKLDLYSERTNNCLLHGDLVLENILIDDSNRIWLIDWEYATLGPPMADIAYLLSLNPELGSNQIEAIKKGYGSQWNDEEIEKWIPLVTSLGLCWYLLQCYQYSQSENLMGRDRYLTNLRGILQKIRIEEG